MIIKIVYFLDLLNLVTKGGSPAMVSLDMPSAIYSILAALSQPVTQSNQSSSWFFALYSRSCVRVLMILPHAYSIEVDESLHYLDFGQQNGWTCW